MPYSCRWLNDEGRSASFPGAALAPRFVVVVAGRVAWKLLLDAWDYLQWIAKRVGDRSGIALQVNIGPGKAPENENRPPPAE